MVETDQKPKKSAEILPETTRALIRACISEEIGTILALQETKEKVLFSTLNTIQNSISLLEKTFSYKLGAIQAAQTKNKAKGIDFEDPQEALAYAKFLQEYQTKIPDVEAHPLHDK